MRTLRNVLAGGSPARAYLFCGPRGTGKTSSARIFAKALCCEAGPTLEPCNRCDLCREIGAGNCMDVLEIDAASNTQVDKIRDFIVDKVHFAPSRARFKVYIIDEVHKLSSSSFNALLKTLEEPPPHVVFILATTHPHELLPTILSRCQRYDFRPLTQKEIHSHLLHVATEENLQLEDAAAEQLAVAADGSLRDALVLLEQALHYCGNHIALAETNRMLGLVANDTLLEWVGQLAACNAPACLKLLEELAARGQDLTRFATSFVDHLRKLMLIRAGARDSSVENSSEEFRRALEAQAASLSLGQILNWLKGAMELTQAIRDGGPPRLLLEMAVVRFTHPEPGPGTPDAAVLQALSSRLERLEQRLAAEDAPGPASSLPSAREVPPIPAPARSVERARPTPRAGDPKPAPSELRPPQAGPAPAIPAPAATAQTESPAAEAPQPDAPTATARTESPVAEAPQPDAPAPAPQPQASSAVEPPPAEPEAKSETPKPAPAALEPKPAVAATPVSEPEVAEPDGARTEERAPSTEAAADQQAPPSDQNPTSQSPATPREFWIQLMNQVKESRKNVRLGAVLADAKLIQVDASQVVLEVRAGYNWHQEQILSSRQQLEEICQRLLNRKVRIECRLAGEETGAPTHDDEHDAMVKKASGLFVGRILD